MIKVILTHEVKDFANWKEQFEAGTQMREQAGVTLNGVYTSVDNPNMVTVSTNFPSKEVVQGFLANPQLKADMEKGGVIGEPEVKILQEA